MAYGNAHWALVVMRRTLDFAVNLDQIPANPFRRKYEMPRKSSEHQKNVYTLRQAEAMLDRVEGLPYEQPKSWPLSVGAARANRSPCASRMCAR